MKTSLRKSWPRILWIAFVLALPAVIIYNYFPKVFQCPKCYLFEDTGDGLKNYYTLAYYVQHDHGWYFSGMNYPYGENIIYTDNEPILAITLKWIDQHIVDMDRHVVGTLNMLLLISLYLAVLITYKLLRRWRVGRWWALATSLCIIFLSPQLWRFHGHYALGYVCFLPMLYLLVDKLLRTNSKKWLWSFFTATWIILMSLIHMYFLLISLVVLGSIIFFWWLYHRKEKNVFRSILPWVILSILLPVILLTSIRKMTDTITDRPTEPYGLDVLVLSFHSTFFPFFPPYDKVWPEILHQNIPDFEKNAYTGLVGLIMLPAILFFFFRKKDEDELNRHVKIFLGAAIMSWLVAGGVFYQLGFKFLWNIVPVLKQFRSLGRLGFPFYYAYMMVASYLIWRFYILLRNRELAKPGAYILSIVFIYWVFEAHLNFKAVSDPVFKFNNYLVTTRTNYVPILAEAGHKPEDFQAILQLPLLSIGSENLGISRGFWTMREGIHASFETGLPLIDFAMSRTSVSQGVDIMELISSPYFDKKRLEGMNDKPILLVCEEEFVTPAEHKIIAMADKIGTYTSITLYQLPIEKLKAIQLPPLPSDKKDIPTSGWFDGFDDHKSDTTMCGAGSAPVSHAPLSLWTYVDTAKTERHWDVSFWSYVDQWQGKLPVTRMMVTDPNGQVISNEGVGGQGINWAEAYRSWIQVTLPLITKGAGYKYELFIDNEGPVIDNLLIAPAGDTCVYHFPTMTLFNNLPIPEKQ